MTSTDLRKENEYSQNSQRHLLVFSAVVTSLNPVPWSVVSGLSSVYRWLSLGFFSLIGLPSFSFFEIGLARLFCFLGAAFPAMVLTLRVLLERVAVGC